MKYFIRLFALALGFALATGFLPAQAQTPPKTLVLYDAPPGSEFEKLGMGYAIMLKNLLGHFDAQTELMPVQNYTAGKINNYDASFYIGAYYNNALPSAFLADAATTQKTLVWFKYNLWSLAWDAAYNFQATRGISFSGLKGLNAPATSTNPAPGFFDTINYKSMPFVKYYKYDSTSNLVNADPDIGVTAIADATKGRYPGLGV